MAKLTLRDHVYHARNLVLVCGSRVEIQADTKANGDDTIDGCRTVAARLSLEVKK